MQRNPLIANIYGYAVCLIAVVVFFGATAGLVGGVVSAIHPTPRGPLMAARSFSGGASRRGMNWIYRARRGEPGMPQAGAGGAEPPDFMAAPVTAGALPEPPLREEFVSNARWNAARRIAVSLALLVLAGVLFERHWRWLNGPSTGAA